MNRIFIFLLFSMISTFSLCGAENLKKINVNQHNLFEMTSPSQKAKYNEANRRIRANTKKSEIVNKRRKKKMNTGWAKSNECNYKTTNYF